MKLVMIRDGQGATAGCLVGDEVLNFAKAAAVLPSACAAPKTVEEILDMTGGGLDAARRVVADVGEANAAIVAQLREQGALTDVAKTRLGPPLPRPHNIFAHGRGYHSHLRDFDPDFPPEKPSFPPVGFNKAVTSVIGAGDAIRLPKLAPDAVDYEGEFAVVFGRRCHEVSRDEAMDYVVGFTIINDLSARDSNASPEAKTWPNGHGAARNVMFKNFDTFCPQGPNVTTKDEIADYHKLRLVTRLNGQVMQDASIAELIWDIPELIETYSQVIPFMPGDILSTGTPGGVGAGRKPPVFLRAGDQISVTVDGIGELSNPVVGP